jgi:hypothetical protein
VLTEGKRVLVRNPDGEGWIAATFFAHGDPEEIDDPRVEGGRRVRDRAWVRYEEGEREGMTGQHAYSEIKEAE